MLTQAIQLSARTIAEFMTTTPASQRRIVQTNKYPSDEEAKAIVAYYRDARSTVEQFFEASRQPSVIATAIDRLASESVGTSTPRKVRLGQNVRALLEFQKSALASEVCQIADRTKVTLDIAGIHLLVRPSLCLSDAKRFVRWLHLDFSDKALEPDKAKIVLQLFLQASRHAGIEINAKCAEYHHLHSNSKIVGAHHGARLEKHIAASCQTFANIWDSI
jgi:hypothetical protein